MMTGTYELYLAKTMLALFSDEPFALPSEELELDGTDLRAHLTNTCLQVSIRPDLANRAPCSRQPRLLLSMSMIVAHRNT